MLVCTCFKLILTHFRIILIASCSESNRTAQHAAAQSAVSQEKENEKACPSEVSLFTLLLPLFRSECSRAEIWIVSSSLRSTHLTFYPHPGGQAHITHIQIALLCAWRNQAAAVRLRRSDEEVSGKYNSPYTQICSTFIIVIY